MAELKKYENFWGVYGFNTKQLETTSLQSITFAHASFNGLSALKGIYKEKEEFTDALIQNGYKPEFQHCRLSYLAASQRLTCDVAYRKMD